MDVVSFEVHLFITCFSLWNSICFTGCPLTLYLESFGKWYKAFFFSFEPFIFLNISSVNWSFACYFFMFVYIVLKYSPVCFLYSPYIINRCHMCVISAGQTYLLKFALFFFFSLNHYRIKTICSRKFSTRQTG